MSKKEHNMDTASMLHCMFRNKRSNVEFATKVHKGIAIKDEKDCLIIDTFIHTNGHIMPLQKPTVLSH
jgi:hypothetical protein